MYSLKDKNFIVTGAARGLGRQISEKITITEKTSN